MQAKIIIIKDKNLYEKNEIQKQIRGMKKECSSKKSNTFIFDGILFHLNI
jgi:hypothetical protein